MRAAFGPNRRQWRYAAFSRLTCFAIVRSISGRLVFVHSTVRFRPSSMDTAALKPRSRSDFTVLPKRLPELSQERFGSRATGAGLRHRALILVASDKMDVSAPLAMLYASPGL